jgi:hypothetical protein
MAAPVHSSATLADEKDAAANWSCILTPEGDLPSMEPKLDLADALLKRLLLTTEDPPQNASPNMTKQSCNKLLDMSPIVETLSDSCSSSSSCFSSCPPPEYFTPEYVHERSGTQYHVY